MTRKHLTTRSVDDEGSPTMRENMKNHDNDGSGQ
jgi:hypothetical protein